MRSGEHERLTRLYLEAVELREEERGEFVERSCRGNPELRAELESLLSHGDDPPEILAPGALAQKLAEGCSAPPERIGPYQILDTLGEGAMGVVYLAEQKEPIQRLLAIKILKRGVDSDEVIARFDSERRALALMDHANIARIYDAGATSRGRPYFAMERVNGEPLTVYCDEQRLTIRERLELFVQVCDGVQHAHQKGVIHRDLKPSNVLVKIEEGGAVPKIIDFGIAKATEQALDERPLSTLVGILLGTPEYMSPEQATMKTPGIDTRTDVYALGVMLYELLVGALPIDVRDLRQSGLDEVLRQIREEEPKRPSRRVVDGHDAVESARLRGTRPAALRKRLAGDLDWITMTALEKDRARRYASVADLAADIGRHLRHEPVSTGPPSSIYRAGKFVRRHRVFVAAGAVVMVALLLGLAGTSAGFVRATRAENRARQDAAIANQVSELLLGLFDASSASRSRGISRSRVLAHGVERIEIELDSQPLLQAQLMHKLGRVHRDIDSPYEARRLVESARSRLERLLGADDPQTLAAANTLAGVFVDLDRFADAVDLYEKTLERQRIVLGDDHPDTLATSHDLAFLYKSDDRLTEAESLFHKAYEGRRRVLGADHVETLLSQSLLASVWLELHRYSEGERLLVEALDRMRSVNHPELANVLYNLGCLYAVRGERDKAIVSLCDAADRGADGSFVSDPSLSSLQGDPDFEECVRLREFSRDRRDGAFEMANSLFRQGDYAKAAPLYRQSVELARRSGRSRRWETAFREMHLAFNYVYQRRYQEAESLLPHALDGMRSVLGGDNGNTAIALWLLAQCHMSRGDTEQALRSLEKSLAICERSIDCDVPYYRAAIHAVRGEKVEALHHLGGYFGARDYHYALVANDLVFASLRGEPEFEKILAHLPQ